jgi:hypothetical protein
VEEVSWIGLTVQLAMGFSLAACAGFRAFLPLLAAGSAARLDLIPLGNSFTWLESNEALLILAVATLVEILGDKIPVVDHLLDTAAVAIKPAAGWLVAAAPLLDLDTKWATILALITGSTVAGAVHLGRAQLRVVSTVTTAGLGNPVLSVGEDMATVAGTVLSIFLPLLAFLAISAALVLVVRLWLRRRRRLPTPATS